MGRKLVASIGTLATTWASIVWATSYDTGVITELYTNNSGHMAIWLNGGFPSAISAAECPSSNGFAGLSPDAGNKEMKATLMMAKAMGQPVKIVVQGCEANGAWYKIVSVYVL